MTEKSYKNCNNFSVRDAFHELLLARKQACKIARGLTLNIKIKINILLAFYCDFFLFLLLWGLSANKQHKAAVTNEKMIIKTAFICCMTFMQLIIGSRSENPVKEIARVGKFFGWLSGKKKKEEKKNRFCDRIRLEIPSCWLDVSV